MKFVFTPYMETIVRALLEEHSAPSVWVYPDWDAGADNSRPFFFYCDASVDGFEPPSSKNKRTAQSAILVSFVALSSSLNATRHRSI